MRIFLRKFAAGTLAALLLLGMLSACADKKTETDPVDESDEETVDFFDRTFKFVSSESESSVLGYSNTTLFGDYVTAHIKDFEQTYSCSISESHAVYNTFKNTMSAYVGSGMYYADQLYTNDETIKNIMSAEYLEPVDSYSEYVDITDTSKWGTYELLETVMYKGTLYAVHPMLWPQKFISIYTPIIYNSDILTAIGYEDPREFYENGTWSRELFTEIVNTAAASDSCTYGLSSTKGFIYQMALLSNNAYLYMKNEDGQYVSATTSQPFTEALDWTYGFLTDNIDSINIGISWDDMRLPFEAGEAAMLMYPSWGLFGGIDTVVKWGLLPFPNGPYREFGDWASYLDGNSGFVSVPVNAEDIEDLSLFMSMFYEPFTEYSSEEELMEYYRTNLFFDDRDFNLFFSLASTARYNYWFEGGNPVVNSLQNTKSTPAKAIESSESLVEKVLTEYLAVNRAAIDKLYDEQPPKGEN